MDDSVMTEFKEAHPKQIISTEIPIPVWKVTYKYKTNRNNDKTAIKYLILEELDTKTASSFFELKRFLNLVSREVYKSKFLYFPFERFK